MTARPARREVLAALAAGGATALLAASLPSPLRAAQPLRVATLDWLGTEFCLTAGLAPVGVADLPGYLQWVGFGAADLAQAADLGSRQQPGLETLARLKPDLILGSAYRHASLEAELARIAPVALLPDKGPGDQLHLIRAAYDACAAAIGADAAPAQSHFDATLAALAETVVARGLSGAPVVLAQPLEGTPRLRVFNADAAAMRALALTGVTPAVPANGEAFGFATMGIEGLAALSPETRLLLLADALPAELGDSAIWPLLPVVKAGGLILTGRVWSFGGLQVLADLSEHAVNALIAGGRG
ncbi:ABC transporter substrate-binding protein [Paracoccus aminophilus]|uniref:ABC transporter substrate-binding protein n=1 Tax=Paracoccus aminophilus TaxID=34003 RepID=UPI00130E177A|nr:ABC transporter substrate-binding protein [Paracoccus aminophilus]